MGELYNKDRYNPWEMGSEFCETEKLTTQASTVENIHNIEMCMSGRTAIDMIIKDILYSNKFVRRVWMPAYCCDSMLHPFMINDIQISFYDVSVDETSGGIVCSIPNSRANDIVYICNFFGFSEGFVDERQIEKINGIKIYDATHNPKKFFMSEMADYYVSSLRKWTYISDAAIVRKKYNKCFSNRSLYVENKEYVSLRNKAADLKRKYLNNELRDCKEIFLELYAKAEKLLEEDYSGYKSTEWSVDDLKYIDFRDIYSKRIRNANILYRGIKGLTWIKPLFDFKNFEQNGVIPLVVPVLIDSKIRVEFRQYMQNYNIYLPIHWPVSKHHEHIGLPQSSRKIYGECISLICDQRYTEEDMEKFISIMKGYKK